MMIVQMILTAVLLVLLFLRFATQDGEPQSPADLAAGRGIDLTNESARERRRREPRRGFAGACSRWGEKHAVTRDDEQGELVGRD